jgi:hypothetical protein
LGQNASAPQRTDQRKYHFRDAFSWSLDEHALKFGADVLRVPELAADVPFNNQGQFYYANDGDATDQAIEYTQFDLIPPLVQPNNDYGFYAQDDWRLTESLTLNLGVRYDVEIGTLGAQEYSPMALLLIEDPRSPFFGEGLPEDDKNNIAPRLGFAWDVRNDGNTVVRGGYGIFYDKVVYNATLFNDADFLGVRGVDVIGADLPGGVVPFGPENLPGFEELYANYGFPFPQDPIIAPGNHFQFAQTQQVTIGVSHQFTPTLALDVDYVRADTSDRGKSYDINERASVAGGNASRLFYPEWTGRIRVAESLGVDTYNGLQVSLRKRMSNNATFTVNYTLGSLEGTADSGWSNEAECATCVGDERDRGPLPNDTRNRLVLGGVFQLPADFQLSAFFQGESGRPVLSGALSSQDLNGNGRRTDFTEGPNGEAAGRGNFIGEPTYTMDLRVAKMIKMGDAKELQLIFEGFNLFNTLNQGANFERTFESANFGNWTGELWTNQFQAQLGVRFSF